MQEIFIAGKPPGWLLLLVGLGTWWLLDKLKKRRERKQKKKEKKKDSFC